MAQNDDNNLSDEIRRYAQERAELNRMLDRTKALGNKRLHRAVNLILFTAVIALFCLQVTFRSFEGFVSLEIGILLVSIKLILMIDSAARFNHFQFWILHSIEQRVNRMTERLDAMDREPAPPRGEAARKTPAAGRWTGHDRDKQDTSGARGQSAACHR